MFIVYMLWGKHGTEGHRHFTCGGDVWDALQKLGKDYGWAPNGTQMPDEPYWQEFWIKHGKYENDYKPDDVAYQKQVSAEDALAWANALAMALPEIQLVGSDPKQSVVSRFISDDDTTMKEYLENSRGMSVEFVKGFIDFLRKGPFIFSWDD